jgi:uncharacterized damage-inducible protein DinB
MTAKTLVRPELSEYAPFYQGYVARVPDGDIVAILERQLHDTMALIGGLTEAQGEHRYAPGKWSLKEVVGHVTDAERIFAYRALRFARGDATPLAAFDENLYVPEAGCSGRTLRDLAEEFRAVRQATLALVRSLTDTTASRSGTASGKTISVRALVYISAGHELHHLAILKERYLGHD